MSIANGEIEVGDTVRFRFPPDLRDPLGLNFIVKALKSSKSNSDNFWVLEGVETPGLFVVDFPSVLEVLN